VQLGVAAANQQTLNGAGQQYDSRSAVLHQEGSYGVFDGRPLAAEDLLWNFSLLRDKAVEMENFAGRRLVAIHYIIKSTQGVPQLLGAAPARTQPVDLVFLALLAAAFEGTKILTLHVFCLAGCRIGFTIEVHKSQVLPVGESFVDALVLEDAFEHHQLSVEPVHFLAFLVLEQGSLEGGFESLGSGQAAGLVRLREADFLDAEISIDDGSIGFLELSNG
jgi:hypothetical protein